MSDDLDKPDPRLVSQDQGEPWWMALVVALAAGLFWLLVLLLMYKSGR